VSVAEDPEEMVVKLTARRDMVAELAAEEAAEMQVDTTAQAPTEEAASDQAEEEAQ